MSQFELVNYWWSLNRDGTPDLEKSQSERPEGIKDRLVIAQREIVGIEMSGDLPEVQMILSRVLDKEGPILKLVRPYLHDSKEPLMVTLEDLYETVASLRPDDA
jgi:hypothetical protein